MVVRVGSDEAQLRAQATIAATLNTRDVNYVVALSQASNTPQWLQDIGGKPMSLGLDLFGGAHFLLQVNMQEYLKGVMANSAEGMRDKLIEERIRFLPGKDWVKGQVIRIPFRDEDSRAAAKDALVDYQDFLGSRPRSGRKSGAAIYPYRRQNSRS